MASAISTDPEPGRECEYHFELPITTDRQLWLYVRLSLGIKIPNKRVCAHHATPWEAFRDAYFAKASVCVWKASRALAGKTYLMATLGFTEATTMGASVSVLGGSGQQSERVLEYLNSFWYAPNVQGSAGPAALLSSEPGKRETRLTNRGRILALAASQTSARGGHPERVRLDEIDEMDWDILVAAMGQAKDRGRAGDKDYIALHTLLSSSHQYADGTMSKVLKMAKEKNREVPGSFPEYTWCVAEGEKVLSLRGPTEIQRLRVGDRVRTRSGWGRVHHVTNTGIRRTIILRSANGAVARLTSDHRVATPSGWKLAGLFMPGDACLTHAATADAMATTRANPDVGAMHAMAARAERIPGLSGPRSPNVLTSRHSLEMIKAYASTATAEMIDLPTSRDAGRTVSDQIGPAVSIHGGTPDLLESIAGPQTSTPQEATCPRLRGDWDVDVVVSHVVSIETDPRQVKVWDIGVEGPEQEFFAGGILVHNCWRETLEPHGWLTESMKERIRLAVPKIMWDREYDLGEPSEGGKVFSRESLVRLFDETLGAFEGENGDELIFEEPVEGGYYGTGADWATEQDWTIITTMRGDVVPQRVVAWLRQGRVALNICRKRFESRVNRYPGAAAHDANGIGGPIHQDLTVDAEGLTLRGRDRQDFFAAYLAAVDDGKIRGPMVKWAYEEHRDCRWGDLFGSGHPPDSVVAGAMAWRACENGSSEPEIY